MVSSIDPNEVVFTGENSGIRLSVEDGGEFTTSASHWRVLLSGAGPGHVLFLRSELTDDQIRIYADNIQMARWLQQEIEGRLNPEFADQSLPVVEAVFSRHGDVRSYSTEKVMSRDAEISLAWYDLGEPYHFRKAPGSLPALPLGVDSIIIPARKAQLLVNGLAAQGRSFPRDREGTEGSTCTLAWSETWLRPR